MLFLERRAEEILRGAIERGEFDNLPGAGKPLRLESYANVPDELRLAYKLLKDAGFLPPELELRKEIVGLKELLATIEDEDERHRLARQINDRVLRLNTLLKRHLTNEDRQVYAGKLAAKLGAR